MAGHSKWSNIKRKKGAADARRGAAFSKVIKKLSSAARRGGGDPSMNAELRMYIQKAKEVNMPADTIKRAIQKATGQLEGSNFAAFTYEGYGPGGIAILIEGATDNKNRTVGNVRFAFSKNGGNLGQDGCVAWMFHEQGIIALAEETVSDPEALIELALEHGAQDFEHEDGIITIVTPPDEYMNIREVLINNGYSDFLDDELTKNTETKIAPDIDAVRANMRLLELLEDDDDVENVYHNLDISDEVATILENE